MMLDLTSEPEGGHVHTELILLYPNEASIEVWTGRSSKKENR